MFREDISEIIEMLTVTYHWTFALSTINFRSRKTSVSTPDTNTPHLFPFSSSQFQVAMYDIAPQRPHSPNDPRYVVPISPWWHVIIIISRFHALGIQGVTDDVWNYTRPPLARLSAILPRFFSFALTSVLCGVNAGQGLGQSLSGPDPLFLFGP